VKKFISRGSSARLTALSLWRSTAAKNFSPDRPAVTETNLPPAEAAFSRSSVI
jgi:hypothetical protein